MSESIVAVIGARRGPWVFTGNFKQPRFQVSGAEEFVLSIEHAHTPSDDDVFEYATYSHDSDQCLPPSAYMRVKVLSEGQPICKIHSE